MAYDFGSQSLGIRNPFRIEGALVALRGGLILALGIYCLFQVAGLVDGRREVEGWLHAGLGLALLVWGAFQSRAGAAFSTAAVAFTRFSSIDLRETSILVSSERSVRSACSWRAGSAR